MYQTGRRLSSRIRAVAVVVSTAAASGVVAFASVAAPAAHAAPLATFTFLNINDFHGRIDLNTVKFAGTIEQLRAAAVLAHSSVDDTVLMAAGDNIGASLFPSFIAQDQPTIDVLKALNMKASSVGNHEFDQGFADLRDRVINGGANANWPYLAANVTDSNGLSLPSIPPYFVFPMTADGQTINVGVIGAVTQETPTLVSPAGVAGLQFGDPVDAVNKYADQLTDGNLANGEADLIIAEYHEGAIAGDPSTIDAEVAKSPVFAKIVNQTSAKVAAVFTGHTHQAYAWAGQVPGAAPGTTRPILETGSYGANVGQVELTVDVGSGTHPMTVTAHTQANIARVTTADVTLISTYPRVAAVSAIVTTALTNADAVGNTVKGSVAADITTAYSGGSYVAGKYAGGVRDDRSKESSLGDLVADSLVSSLSDPVRGGAQIGVVNPGGLRAELFRAPDTAVTYAEANAVLPFLNNLGTETLTGAQLKTMLEQQWQRDAVGNVPSRPYLQLGLSSNVTYTYDAALAEGSRITSIMINGVPVAATQGYRVGTFSFLLDGGDNFRIFTSGTDRRDSGLVDRDAWIDYISTHSPLSPDFGRQGVAASNLPSVVVPGQPLNFQVSALDLTSLGAPLNTTVAVTVGGRNAGTVPVIGGAATINATVPSVPAGAANLVLTAQPSGTTVTIPVTVAPTLTTLVPTRLFDTRPGESPNALRGVPKVKVGPTSVLQVQVSSLTGLTPTTGIGAVSLNVAVANPTADGFVTVYDCGTRQLVANVNYVAGQTVSNAVLAPVSATGAVCFYSMSPTDLVVDINGWTATGSAFTAVSPSRVFDTRPGESPGALLTVAKTPVGGSNVLEVQMTGLTGVTPATGVGAVSLNVGVTDPAAAGFLTVYTCGTRQLVSSVNYGPGETVSNAVIAPLSATGTVCFYSMANTDVVVDINGWFASGSAYNPVGPIRLFDTRAGESPNALRSVAPVKVGGSYVLEVKVASLNELTPLGGIAPIPLNGLTPSSGVGAVALNVVATNGDAAGFITAYACGATPFAANVNFSTGVTGSNLAIVPVSADGTVCFFANQPVDIVVDLDGWFASAT